MHYESANNSDIAQRETEVTQPITKTRNVPVESNIQTESLYIPDMLQKGRDQDHISEQDYKILIALNNIDNVKVNKDETIYSCSSIDDVGFHVPDGSTTVTPKISGKTVEPAQKGWTSKVLSDAMERARGIHGSRFPKVMGPQAPTLRNSFT